MLTPNNIFSGSPQVTVIPTTYPAGYMNDETSEGAEDGAYINAALMNDAWGFFQACVLQANTAFSETPETADSSQILDGIKKVTNDPRAPWIVAEITADTADVWAESSDSVNVGTIDTPTGVPGVTNGNLAVSADESGDGFVAHVSPSSNLARTGLNMGVDSESNFAEIGASTAYGHRALIQYNGTNWVTLEDTNDKVNSQIGGPSITSGTGYVQVEFSDVNGMELGDLWSVQCLSATPELDFLATRVSGKSGKAVKINFVPRHPVRGIVSISAGNIASLVSGSWNGLSVSYDNGTKILTVTHVARKGPAHVTVSSGGPTAAYVVKALPVSDTVTQITFVDGTGALLAMTSTSLSFTRDVGGAENVPVQGTPILAITNGLGVIAQDFAKLLGTFNLTHVSKGV